MKLFVSLLVITFIALAIMMFTDKPALAWLVLAFLIVPLGFMLSEEELT